MDGLYELCGKEGLSVRQLQVFLQCGWVGKMFQKDEPGIVRNRLKESEFYATGFLLGFSFEEDQRVAKLLGLTSR